MPAYLWRMYMGNNIVDASLVKLKPTDKLLFDCNVLMYIFYTYGNYSQNQIGIYKSLFRDAIKNNCEMCIPSIEISEFINTYIRNEYNRYLRKNHLTRKSFDFKHDYRATKDYEITIGEVKAIVSRQILAIFNKLDDNFSQVDISDIYDAPKQFDFNDRFYYKLAEKHSLIIITNDSDFSYSNGDVKIITANHKLLANSCIT